MIRLKQNLSRILYFLPVSAACVLLGLLFGRVLLVYTVPMRDASYDLSLFGDEAALPEDRRIKYPDESKKWGINE